MGHQSGANQGTLRLSNLGPECGCVQTLNATERRSARDGQDQAHPPLRIKLDPDQLQNLFFFFLNIDQLQNLVGFFFLFFVGPVIHCAKYQLFNLYKVYATVQLI